MNVSTAFPSKLGKAHKKSSLVSHTVKRFTARPGTDHSNLTKAVFIALKW